MAGSKTYTLDPIDEIKRMLVQNGYPAGELTHITYDPEVNDDYDYRIIRSSAHDGTLIFTHQNVDSALLNLVNKKSYYTEIPDELDDIADVRYEIGDITIKAEYRKVKWFEGQDETVSIPVKFYYERKTK